MGLEEEIRELERRFSESPDSRLFLPLADALRRAGETGRAAKLCREGLERFPDFTSARALLGKSLTELGELEQAEKNFEDLLVLDEKNCQALEGLIDLASRRDDPDRVRSLRERLQRLGEVPAREVVRLSPETNLTGGETESLAVRESAESRSAGTLPAQEPERAEEDQVAGELFVTHTLGDIYRLQGHYGKAYEVYHKLLERVENDPVLKQKLEEVGARLEQAGPEISIAVAPGTPAAKSPSSPDFRPGGERPGRRAHQPPAEAGVERIEERIDAIFRFMLGDEPPAGVSARLAEDLPAGGESSGEFVDLLADWITGLKSKEQQ